MALGCAELGHALHTIDGELQLDCLRCEAELSAEAIATCFDRMELSSARIFGIVS